MSESNVPSSSEKLDEPPGLRAFAFDILNNLYYDNESRNHLKELESEIARNPNTLRSYQEHYEVNWKRYNAFCKVWRFNSEGYFEYLKIFTPVSSSKFTYGYLEPLSFALYLKKFPGHAKRVRD